MLGNSARLVRFMITISLLIFSAISGISENKEILSTTVTLKEKVFNYNFSIRDNAGKQIAFEEFKGKVLFINLWATWCGPCRFEMPTIQQLYSEVDHDQIKFIMLSLDKEKTVGNVPGYLKSNGYTFPVYHPAGFLPEQLQVPYIPTTFIISKEGKIVAKEVGGINFNTPKFKKLLKEEAAK